MLDPLSGAGDRSFGETEAFIDILNWSADRPPWQKDALRRLVLGMSLSDGDIDELMRLCADPTRDHEALSEHHISAQHSTCMPISLVRIDKPKGINALAAEQTLHFAGAGLTVIYGDNGAGKSGYVRVLKHACRTRDRGVKILRDIEDSVHVEQSAEIVLSRGPEEISFAWTPDGAAHPDLPSISIFDSRSANVHVEKTNAVAYIPLPMQVLEALASVCDRLKAKLEMQLQEIAEKTPLAIRNSTLDPETAAGAFVRDISAKSNVAQLDLLAKLSDAEVQRLTTLEGDLAQDPHRAASRLRLQKSRLEGVMTRLRQLCAASSPSAFQARDRLKDDWDAKALSAKLASDALFAASPLPHVGEAVWRQLWEAARKYSDEVAYPDKQFPDADGHDELCVLCQQPLGEDAVQRRTTFESFVKSSTKTDEEKARRHYQAALEEGSRAAISTREMRKAIQDIALEIGDTSLAMRVRECWLRAAWSLRALIRGLSAPATIAEVPADQMSAAIEQLERRGSQLSADHGSPERQALVAEYKELKARESLGALVEDLKAEIERQREVELIKKAIKETAKRGVTDKNKELSDKLVTNALRGRFAREIEKLKLARMPVELKKIKDSNAISYFQVTLVERPNEAVGEIFSEGEHRCVALAAFLAELVTSKQYSGIVFDDPMSSLDHIHRKAVAARLVEESVHRQVVVFTHDLTFLFELRRECELKGLPIFHQTVCRRQNRPGYIEGELPMKGKSAWQLAQSLRSELKTAKHHFDGWPDARRTIFAKGIIEQLRECWDQGIGDFISPVLGRFDNAIKGTSLYKLAILTEQDVRTVTAARGRLSEELHTSSETLNPETVAHADLLDEVIKLETWLADMNQRQKEAVQPTFQVA
ncbi:hypothetical protein LCM4579_22365 [Ensifer sp. LCM 4579]|nr:hypothetical protein LCM4579_22365 [Ensifer sp. LCM 4579]